jgi:PAS domain-containing protein
MKIPGKILEYIPRLRIPKTFWGAAADDAACLYLVSCVQKKTLFINDRFVDLLGYPAGFLLDGGLDWWFSLVHPEDLEPMLNEVFQQGFLRPAHERLNGPFAVEYRARNINEEYRWICETKCIVSLTPNEKNDLLLGRYEDITAAKIEAEARNFFPQALH